MSKINISRTYGPIHFEDLDPHRFEDLVRELIYDYKDWQSIERSGDKRVLMFIVSSYEGV